MVQQSPEIRRHRGEPSLRATRPEDRPGRSDHLDRRMTLPEGPVPSPAGGERLLELVKVIHRLQAPDGCPWDREQTHQSLARHLLEEAHETLEAIDTGDLERLRE